MCGCWTKYKLEENEHLMRREERIDELQEEFAKHVEEEKKLCVGRAKQKQQEKEEQEDLDIFLFLASSFQFIFVMLHIY